MSEECSYEIYEELSREMSLHCQYELRKTMEGVMDHLKDKVGGLPPHISIPIVATSLSIMTSLGVVCASAKISSLVGNVNDVCDFILEANDTIDNITKFAKKNITENAQEYYEEYRE